MTVRDVKPPEGKPTFVFTDIEGSSALWEAVPEAMGRALRAHDALMHAACASQNGYAVKAEGDAFMIAFEEPRDAIHFAQLVQQTLARMTWPEALEAEQRKRGLKGPLGLRVRIGMHYGAAELRTNQLSGRADYFGASVNIAARLSDMAHGAQTLISEDTLKRSGSPDKAIVSSLGPTAVRGMKQKVSVHQMVASAWWPIEFPPLRLGRVVTEDTAGRPVARADLNSEMEGVAFQLLTRAQIERFGGNFDGARFELRALQAVAEWLNEEHLLVECLLEQAIVETNQGKYVYALELVRKVLHDLEALNDPILRCRTLLDESVLLRYLYRFKEARQAADAALVLSWKTDDLRVTARARGCLAELDRMEGSLEKAEAGMRAALDVLREQGDQIEAREITLQLGMLLVERGEYEAVRILSDLVTEYDTLHMSLSAAAARVNLALYYLDHGEGEPFFELNHKAEAVFREATHEDHCAAIVLNRAFFHLRTDNLEGAWDDLWTAGERFPVELKPGLDLEGAVLHVWLLYLRGEQAALAQGLPIVNAEAAKDLSLLGPMVVQLMGLLSKLIEGDVDQIHDFMNAHQAPATVTFRAVWRSMVEHQMLAEHDLH